MNANDMKKPSETNLERFDALDDETIDTSDIPPLSEGFFERATWRMPKSLVAVTVEVEPEILEWYKAQGGEWQRRLSAALRIYVEAYKAPISQSRE
jgi:uncharacterized protein (DUF4415 family)